MSKIIIKGLIYTDGDTLLRAHYSGDFHTVDMTEYKTKKEIQENYSEYFLKERLKGFYLTYQGVKYYECEFSPYHTDRLELLSDISEIDHFDEETNFD